MGGGIVAPILCSVTPRLAGRRDVLEDNQPAGIGIRQRAQQHGIDDAERRDRRPDSNRENRDHRDGERPLPSHTPPSETQVEGKRHPTGEARRERRDSLRCAPKAANQPASLWSARPTPRNRCVRWRRVLSNSLRQAYVPRELSVKDFVEMLREFSDDVIRQAAAAGMCSNQAGKVGGGPIGHRPR
jgi:hypothetical protein